MATSKTSKQSSKSVSSTSQAATSTTSTKRIRKPNVTVLLDTDDVVREQVGGFVTFLREHAIVGLAVGFIAGAQAQAVVKQLVTSFIDPSIQLFFGGAKLSDRSLTLHLFNNQAKFGWGAMMYAVINLIIVLATVYALIKIFKLDKLDKPKVAIEVEKPTDKKPRKRNNPK